MQQFNVIGLMSGTSLDGVDLCYVEFYDVNGRWKYKNCVAQTIEYNEIWKARLREVEHESALQFCKTHSQYGHYLGALANSFIQQNNLEVDLISSHGHTIFHQPQHQLTTQIGDGAAIYAVTGIKTVTDLRCVDVALGGEGAPLVPLGERDLFEDYGMFLNLGGIANISVFHLDGTLFAYDISPCNMPLNMQCEKYFNTAFDEAGKFASQGKLNESLLRALQEIPYFSKKPPKSLGREFIVQEYFPAIENASIAKEDRLYTTAYHIANEVSNAINKHAASSRRGSVFVTGGGVYNHFLMGLIESKCVIPLTLPSRVMIEFKEALIFAYLGVLRMTNKENALASVTNAKQNSMGGALWG